MSLGKVCTSCGFDKPLTEFYRQPRGRFGVQATCIPCFSKQTEDARILRRYGITREQYDLMLERQGGVCELCREPETNTYRGRVRLLSVDHCHVTGRVRGLLCSNCNRGIGLLRDDPELLRAAAEYLEGDG